ncbi:UNVERIFIED_CONTAM: acetyltransferase (GNAT) family protein [Acetivibrio alkalicellulosi]
MELKHIRSLKEYKEFYRQVYFKDSNFKDNKTNLLPIVCEKNSAFYKGSDQEMIAVIEEGNVICQCVLINHSQYKEAVFMAFFEALSGKHEGVKLLINYAIDFGKRRGCTKIIAGIDGHPNNSIGFLVSNLTPPTFGECYNKRYYAHYFSDFNKIDLVSFIGDYNKVKATIDEDFNRHSDSFNQFDIEYGDFSLKGFEKTIKIYTDLSNKIFVNHRDVYYRSYEEDYELFFSMRMILKNENLIFVKKAGEYIGFCFWYPDFNELIGINKYFGVTGFIKYKILGKIPCKMKMVEIGVVPQYQNKGLVLMLFKNAIDIVANKYPKTKKIVSSWILSENKKSTLFTRRYTKELYKEYVYYEKSI